MTIKAAGRMDAVIGVVPITLPSTSTSRLDLVWMRITRAFAR